jgi:hypothetical protein
MDTQGKLGKDAPNAVCFSTQVGRSEIPSIFDR